MVVVVVEGGGNSWSLQRSFERALYALAGWLAAQTTQTCSGRLHMYVCALQVHFLVSVGFAFC